MIEPNKKMRPKAIYLDSNDSLFFYLMMPPLSENPLQNPVLHTKISEVEGQFFKNKSIFSYLIVDKNLKNLSHINIYLVFEMKN